MMSRKDYTKIAESIHDSLDSRYFTATEFRLGVAETARNLADVFKADNPHFRHDFFFEACGLNSMGYLRADERRIEVTSK